MTRTAVAVAALVVLAGCEPCAIIIGPGHCISRGTDTEDVGEPQNMPPTPPTPPAWVRPQRG